MSFSLDEQLAPWQNTTMLVENEHGKTGTGFLIKPSFSGSDGYTRIKWFLVTNKHVLHLDEQKRAQATEIVLYPRTRGIDGTVSRRQEIVGLVTETGEKIWREHPDPNVDVLLIDLTGLILGNTLIEHDTVFGLEAFGDLASINRWKIDVTLGAEVGMIGYPNLLTGRGESRTTTSDPIVYRGTLATPFDQALQENDRTVRGFLINATGIPGASGSPVILWPGQQVTFQGRTFLGSKTPPLLLGILAETRFGEIQVSRFGGQAFADACMAYSADTIIETSMLFTRE